MTYDEPMPHITETPRLGIPTPLDAMQARAFRTLLELAGHVGDGSCQAVSLSQDDATREWVVRAGKRWWHGRSPLSAIAAAYEDICAREAADARETLNPDRAQLALLGGVSL